MTTAATVATAHAHPVGTGVYPRGHQCRRSAGTAANGTTTTSGQVHNQPVRPRAP
jgi:hypothetical protein